MRAFVILFLVSLAAADVSEILGDGYNYPQPSGSGSGSLTGIESGQGSGGDIGLATSFEPSVSGGGFGQSGGNANVLGGVGPAGGIGIGSGISEGGDGGFGAESTGPSVSKRFFTFTGQDHNDGDDDEDVSSSTRGGHKNIDVIFAKAPSTSIKSALKAVAKYAGEHQTAVYVLSQQLGAAQIGDALRASGIKPNKPQVHFIKYKTPEEAAHAQQQIRSQYDALGGSTQDGGEASAPVQSVVGSLGRGRKHNSSGGGHGHGISHGSSGNGRGPAVLSLGGHKNYVNFGGSPSGISSVAASNRYLPPRY